MDADDDDDDSFTRKDRFRQPPKSPLIGSNSFGINLSALESVSPSLRELSTAHGVHPHDAHLYMTKVDLFQPVDFSLQTLDTFSKLIEVVVIQAPRVTSLIGLSACRHLKKLFVVECALTSLAGLEELTSLTHLCLDGNGIGRIREESFSGCGHSLQVLSLNENRIPRIEGLWRCTRLRELNLARNFISGIGDGVGEFEEEVASAFMNQINNNNNNNNNNSRQHREESSNSSFMFPSPSYEDGTLSGLSNLHVLQLGGNRISSFRDITRLSTQLPSLRHLFLNDPHWGSNPVCSLANYNTFALCSLPPHVQSLDSTNITREARAVALAKFTRKSMHYSMRLRKVKRSLIAVQETARIVAEVTVSMLSASLPSLHFAIRTLEAHIVAAEDEINAVYSLAIPVTSSALPLVSVPSSSLSTTPSLVGEIQTINNNRDTASNIQSLPSLLLPPSIPLPKSPLLAHCAWPPLRPLAGLASTPPPLLFAAKSKRSMLIALVSKREADICALNEALAALNISVRTCAAVFSERIDVELNTGRNTSFEEVLPSSSTTHPHHPPFSSNKQLSNNESSIFPQQVTMNMHQMMMMTSPVKMISSSSSSSSFSSLERESSSIFTACSRFVKSRFLKESFSCLHVADVKVSRVVKVSNNQLRSRFEKRVAALVETVPFLKQAIDEFFIPHCDSSLATFGGEEKEEEQGGSSNSGGGGGGGSEQSMSLRSAMSLLLGESGMRTGVDFVMFSPRWCADGIAAAASVSTPTALQQPLQKNSLQHQQHQQQIFKSAKAGTIIGGQSSLSMSLQDAVGVGIGPSSIWKNGSSLRDAHHRSGSTTNKDLHRHTNSTSSFSSSSLHISAEAESESVRRSISRIAESGFSAVDATVATPTQPLFPDYCTPPSPSFASPTLNMKPARTNRLDVAAQSSVLNHHQHIRKGRRGGGGGGASSGSSPLDFDNIPLHPPLGATLLPCLSASTALGIPVTNSLACADLPRLAEAVAARLELKKELHWRRARFPEYSAEMATATSTDNNNNSYSGNSYSTDESRRLLSSSSSSRVKNTQENSFAFYTPTRAERETLLSRMSLNGGNTTQKGDNSVNIVNKISSSSSLNGSKKDSTTRTSSSSSSSSINATRSNKVALSQPSVQSAVQSAALTVAASQAQMLDWLRPRVNIPLFAALDLGPAHWLACAGIDIHSLIHKSILRKALRAATLTNSNGYGGGEDEDEEGEGSATIGSRQLLSSQQIAAAAASASILSPAPFSGPIRQSFTGRMNTPGGGGGGDSSNNGGRGGSGISRIFSPLSTSSASLSPLASSSSMIRSGRVILCRSFLGNVLDLCSGTNLLEASQGARHLPTSFYGDPLLTPAGQAAAALAHSTSQRLLSRHTTDNKGEGGTVKKTATPSVTTSATSFDSQQSGSSKGGGSGGQLNGAQIFGAEGGERLWAVLDPHLLVPEYIVDFSYVFEGEDDAEKEAAAAVTAIMLDSSSSLSSSTTTTTTISEEKNRIERQKMKKMKKNPVPSSSEVPISTSPSSCAIPTPSSSVQSASISSVSSTSSPPPSSPSSKNKETTKNRRQAGDMENTSPPLAPSSRSDLANALLRLHSICCSPTSLSKSSSSNFATLSSSERSQLSSSNLGQTFQAAAAMLRKARSMRSGGGVGGGGGGAITEASVSSLTLALQSIANLISFDRSSSEQQQQQQQQRSSLLSLLLPPAEDVELRALLPSLLSFSRLIVDVASLYLGGGPSRVVTDGSEYMNDPQVNTSKSGGMGEIRYPLNSTLIDSVALDALSMLPRTSPFESRIGKDNNEGDYNNRRRSLLSTPPWLTAITSSSLLSSSHWLPQELSIVTVNSTGDTIDHIESISKKMDPLEMFIQSNPSLMLASSSSSSSSSTSLTTKVPSLPLSQPLTLCLSASALANLTSLCLDGCGLSGRLSLYGIASCSGLRRISLAFNRLTHLDGLSSCAALHEVDASYNLVKSLLIDEGATTIKKEKKVMNGTTGGATDRTRRGKKNAWGRVNNKIENEDEEEEENDIGGEIGGDSGRKNRVYSDTDALERSNSTAYESVLGACHFLHDLRLSHNLFSNISDVLLGIMRRPMLRVLDLRGNPFLLPSSERSKSSYLPRVLSSLPGLGVLDECSITEADWRLVEANRCKFKQRSVLQQPELIARIAVGGEKASRDAFLFQPIARADEEEEEEDDDDDDDGWKVRSHITHNDDVDDDDIYWQSLRECGKDCDKALAVSSVVFDSIAAEAMRLLDRHPPLRLPHSLDLSGMYISGSALRTKQAAYTLAAMPSLKKLSLSNNAMKSLVEENDVASHHHHHQRDHHFTLSALSMATNLTELDLHNCNLRVLAHSHSAMVHAKHVKMSNENNSIPAAASVGAAETSAVVTSSSSSSMMTSGMFDLLTDLSSLVSNIVRVHREVDASSSTPSAHHDHHHSFDDENIIVSDLTADRIKRFPLWGFAMTKGATGICALISSEEQQNGGRDTSDRRQSALDVYPSSSSSSSVSLTIDLDRDDHSRFTESDSPSPFLTPIVVASTVDAEDDDENNENNINLIISGKSRDAFDEAATVVTTSREFAVASNQKQQLQQQQLQQQQRLSSRQGSSGTSRKSSSTTTPQPIEASSSSSSPINSPFIVAGLPGLPHTSFSPVDLSTPPSLLLPNPPSSSSSIRFVKFLPLIPLVSPLLASGSNLRRLDLSYNELCDKAVIDARLDLLPNLITLSLERNKLRTFDGVKGCSGLLELYLGLNEIGGGGGGGGEEGSERRRTRGLGLKKNDDDGGGGGDGDDSDGDDEEGRQSDATTSSPFSNSEESLRHSSSMFAIPLGSSSSSSSTLLSSTASPLLRMLRALASEPVSIISEGGTVSPRNVMNANAGGNGSGVISTAPLPLLSILDLTGNPIASVKGYREATLRRARKLRVLDGVSVSAADLAAAGIDRLNGKLTVEWLEDRAAALAEEEGGGIHWADVPLTDGDEDVLDASLLPRHPLSLTLDLDYASAHIRDVELLSPLSLPHVRSISLDHNQLSDEGIGGLKLLLYSPTLKSLSLNHNKVVSLLPALGREKGAAAVVGGGGGGGGAPEEIASTIISLLPQLSKESKIWGSVYGKNKSVASTNHETRDEEMVSLQRGDEGSGNGREGVGEGDGRGRGGVDEVLSREINKSGANSNAFLRAGSGGAAAAASILAAMEKDYEGGGGGGGGIMNEDVRRNHQYQIESSTSMNEEERRTSSSFFLHQSHSKGAPPPNHHHHHHHLSPNYNHNITLINSRDIYCRLERLHLVHNGIVSMEGLGLLHLPKLREIDLSHNEIAKVGGLAGCKSLSSITLNGNVIRALDLVYLSRSCPLLTHLSVMDNGLRSLTGNAAVSSANSISSFGHLRHLLSVNLSSNRISDVNELEPLLLFAASSLITSVSFALNPVSRRPNYRSALLARLPELLSIDGREVLMEERGGGGGQGGGGVGQGGGLVATHFLHQQGHGGAQQHQSQQQQTNSQVFKLFGQVGQTSGQLLGQQQQQQQHQRIIQSSQPLYQQASIHMGPLALSMVAALNNVKGGEVTGGNGNGGVNENIVKESSSVTYSGGAVTFSTANGGQTPSTNGGQMLSSTSVATERLPKELTLSSKLLTKDHSSSSSSSSGAPAAASAAQTQSSSSLSSSSSLLSSSSSSLFGLPSSSDRLMKDSPSPYGVIPHGNTAGAAQSVPSTTAGAQSTPILTRGGGESSSVNVGHDALFGAVVNHYKERGNGGVGGEGGGGGSGGGTSSYYVMHRGNGVGKGSLLDKEKSSSSGLSSSRSEGGGLSLTTISLSLPKTGKKNGKSGGNNGKKVDR